jgi:predicted transcriptional regulator
MTSLPRLTLRKVSILLHLEAGRSYKQIAADLGIHEATVRAHVQAIADDLPSVPAMPPKDKALLWCERLLTANADIVAQLRRAA